MQQTQYGILEGDDARSKGIAEIESRFGEEGFYDLPGRLEVRIGHGTGVATSKAFRHLSRVSGEL